MKPLYNAAANLAAAESQRKRAAQLLEETEGWDSDQDEPLDPALQALHDSAAELARAESRRDRLQHELAETDDWEETPDEEAPDDDDVQEGNDRSDRFMWSPDELHFEPEALQESFQESEHPRADNGEFGSGGGGAKKQASDRRPVFSDATDAAKFAETAVEAQPLSEPESSAISAYRKTSAVWDINNYLRGKPSVKQRLLGLGGANKEVVKNLDAAIAKSKTTQDMTTMRGMKLPTGQAAKLFSKGSTFTDNAYVSTTMASSVAERFSQTIHADHDQVTISIHVPKGSNAYAMPRKEGEFDEAELMLPRGARFEVEQVKTEGRNVHVELVYRGTNAAMHESQNSRTGMG